MKRIAILLAASLMSAEPAVAQSFETSRVATGVTQPIFLTAALIRRLVPWTWRRTWRKGRLSIFQEAKASTDRITPMVFTG
jgi:hypothetical protein